MSDKGIGFLIGLVVFVVIPELVSLWKKRRGAR